MISHLRHWLFSRRPLVPTPEQRALRRELNQLQQELESLDARNRQRALERLARADIEALKKVP